MSHAISTTLPATRRRSVFASIATAVAVASLLAIGAMSSACAGRIHLIAGTQIADTPVNHSLIDVVETYRHALEKRDADALLLMASPKYWEDSGTQAGGDDYGYDGLKRVLSERFLMATEIRYAMRYVAIHHVCPNVKGPVSDSAEPTKGCRAHVEVMIDASYSVQDALGHERRPDKRDQNELVLEWTGDRWQFISGM